MMPGLVSHMTSHSAQPARTARRPPGRTPTSGPGAARAVVPARPGGARTRRPRRQEAAMPSKDTSGGQTHVSRREDETEEVEVEERSASDLKERHEKLSEDVDSLLDEIDDVLEENAEEFVRGYVQKG